MNGKTENLSIGVIAVIIIVRTSAGSGGRERAECGVKLRTGGISMDDQCRIMPKVTSWKGISVDAPDVLPVASSLSNASSLGKFFPSFPLFLLSSLVLCSQRTPCGASPSREHSLLGTIRVLELASAGTDLIQASDNLKIPPPTHASARPLKHEYKFLLIFTFLEESCTGTHGKRIFTHASLIMVPP